MSFVNSTFNMVFIITFVFSGLLHFAIGGSMLVHDLFFKAAGSTFSNLPRNCSYDCTQISNKMVTFDTVIPFGKPCPLTLKPYMNVSYEDSPCNQKGTISCSYCAHKREKYVILKQSCSIKPPKTCHHNEHIREVNCYNCKVNDLQPLEEDLWCKERT